MKTKAISYAEQKGKEIFDWNAFFKKKTYTLKELRAATIRSGNWVTCACGNQCAILERDDAEPTDERLRYLGTDFADHVYEMERGELDKPNKWVEPKINCSFLKMCRDSDFRDYKRALKKAEKRFNDGKRNAIKTLAKIEKRSAMLIQKEIKLIQKKAILAGYKLVKA